jgi:DNA-binding LytR/AlgR family response regulator
MQKKQKVWEKIEFPGINNSLIKSMDDISCFEAAGKNFFIFLVNGKEIKVKRFLRFLEGRLDPDKFYRCHDGYIVNLYRVEKVTSVGSFLVIMLTGGKKAQVCKRKVAEFKKLLQYISVLSGES